MDSEYLKSAVGDALAKSLASVSQLKPADPVEYVALWLAQYVQNQQREQQAKDDGKKLEEERVEHQRKLEFERLRREEEERVAREEAERRAREAQRQRQAEFDSYQDGINRTEANIEEQTAASDRQKKNKDKVAPLHAPFTRFHYLTAFASGLSNQELVNSKTISDADFHVVKLVLYLVGRKRKEFQKWAQAKKVFKEVSIGHFNPLSKQPAKKFAHVAHQISKVAKSDLEGSSLYINVLYDWAVAAVRLRRAALDLKDAATGTTTEEQPIDPEATEEEEEEEEPEEQEDLEKYNVREPDVEEPEPEPTEEEAPAEGEAAADGEAEPAAEEGEPAAPEEEQTE